MSIIAPDVSYYQKRVDDTFSRQWLIFRCCDGSFLDPNASYNAVWCQNAMTTGKLLGWTVYVVYRPGQNASVMANLRLLGALDYVMIDVESWGGQIQGDHTAELNQLVAQIATLVGADHVWGYGNTNDLATIWPGRRVPTIGAGYGPTQPGIPNLIGWQYTNGSENHTSMPSSSPPFGACDHNELYVDAHVVQGGGTPITNPTEGEEDDMPKNFHVHGQDAAGNSVTFIVANDLSHKIQVASAADEAIIQRMINETQSYEDRSFSQAQLNAIPTAKP